MLQILSITLPIFILIGLGFFAVRFEVISREQIRGLGSFVITFALPALVLKAVSDSPFQEVMNWQYLLAYCAGSLIVYLLGLLFALRVRPGQSRYEASGPNSSWVRYCALVQARMRRLPMLS